MDSRRRILIVAVAFAGLMNLVRAQVTTNANVPNREILAKEGATTNFSCTSNGVPLFLCIWEREAKSEADKITVTINSELAISGKTSRSGYGYVGAGLDSGSCGLVVQNMTDADSGIWNCKLLTAKTDLFQGDVRVSILKKPNKPEFSPNVKQIQNLSDPDEQNVKVSVTCGSYGGQPWPKFRWFIGTEELTEGLGAYENTTYAGHLWIHQTLTGHKFTSKDNGQYLRCVLVHDALDDNDVKEVSERIIVHYAPKATTEVMQTFVPTIGDDATLSINISSNPKPQVVWRINETVISPPQKTDKYTAYNLVEITKGVWAIGLQIRNVDEEDLMKIYKLEARNIYGTVNYDLRITSNNPATAGGLSAGGIIGLFLGIPALLILIAVIVVYTRARGLLCFKGDDGTASEKERMDGEIGGAGAGAEEKPVTVAQSLSSRLSAIYENLVAKKKDKTSPPTEEEANKEKEAIPADESPVEKKPEDIVYAELDLVNEIGGKPVVRCTDDKTEYAEIVGTVPLGSTLQEPPTEKSPGGSVNHSPKK